MKSVSTANVFYATSQSARWLPMFAGVLLYVPTYHSLLTASPNVERTVYAYCILGLAAWLFWRERYLLQQPLAASRGQRLLGAAILALGLLSYVLGRVLFIPQFEVSSQIPVLLGLTLFFFGAIGLRHLWFACSFLIFLIPIPVALVDQLLLPLKQLVSAIVDGVLYSAGYPIARDGVTLSIGPYRLLIADACSGLNSMVALSGIGLLYVAVVDSSRLAKTLLLLCILPIAFFTNVLRVLALVLCTFYFGDDAGRSFHDVAAFAEIGLAFGSFFIVDSIFTRWLRVPARRERGVAALAGAEPTHSLYLAVSAMLAATALLAWALTPQLKASASPVLLEALIPLQVGSWQAIASPQMRAVLTTAPDDLNTSNPYDAVLLRSYRNASGDVLMLALAYARNQYQEVKIHRPEVCYQAQGFAILSSEPALFELSPSNVIGGRHLLASNHERLEAVSYWIRVGDLFSASAWETRQYLFMQGLEGRVPDGILVRVSQLVHRSNDAGAAFQLQGEFLRDLVHAVSTPQEHSLLTAAIAHAD